MSKYRPTNAELNLPKTQPPSPRSSTEQELAEARERKKAYLAKFRADRAKQGQ